ncbi:MAG: flagellar motor switch protein FliM [Ignavibacteriales bacterium]|nr:flagellar motor switch protein FliM [Ignavibacteriales bacterium]
MPEILSQQEIDSLLAGISTGVVEPVVPEETERKAVRDIITFDFRLPHRLSKNQLRTLQAVHEGFSETFGSYLISRLQTNLNVSVTSVDQIFYSEYVLSIGNPSCLYLFRIVESDALAVIELSPQLVLSIVSRLLGGSLESEKDPRLITQIEQSIIKGIVLRALSDLQKAWKTVGSLTFQLERYESEGDFVQIAPMSEIVLLVSLELSFGDQKYLMNICFPTFALDEVLSKLNTQSLKSMTISSKSGKWSTALMKDISTTTVPATAVLGYTTIALSELLELEPGDILRTNLPISGEVEVDIGGKPWLWGRPGVSNGRMAVKVQRVGSEAQKDSQ